jgi:hypothetical protein
MFRENKKHLQEEFFSSTFWMDKNVRERLMKGWSPLYYEHVFSRIDEKIFASLYNETTGRPNFPVNILLSLEYFKHIYNYNDEELIEQFYFNTQISYALGIKNVSDINLAPRTLYYFRSKIYQYAIDNPKKEDMIFEQFITLTKEFAKEANITTDKQRMDSTFVKSNIKKSGRLALVLDVLEKVVRIVPIEYLSEDLKIVKEANYTRKLLYQTKNSEIKNRLEYAIGLCICLKDIMLKSSELLTTKEYKLLERLLLEQINIDEIKNEYSLKSGKSISANSLQSAYDMEATYRKKAEKESVGYILNVSETCSDENDVQLITDYNVDKNIVSDVELINLRLPEIKENTNCSEITVDGGYYSDSVIDTATELSIKVNYTDMTGGKPSENNMSILEFKLDENNKILQCPIGIEPLDSYVRNNASTAHFIKSDCYKCAKKDLCIIKPHEELNGIRVKHETIKAELTRKDLKKNRKTNISCRAAVEGTISELKRKHGANDTKVRGLLKTHIVEGLKVSACNIKRFIKFLSNNMIEITENVISQSPCISMPILQ